MLFSIENIRMKRVLITGISGFIGHYLHLYRTENINLSGTYFKNKLSLDETTLYYLDLLNVDNFISESPKFDVIVHCAAESSLINCEEQPDYAYEVNAVATKKLVKWSKKQKSRFIYLSTDIVFSGDKGNYIETDKPDPINVYGRTKLAAEDNILSEHSNAVIARIALCFGKGLGKTQSFIDWLQSNLEHGEDTFLFSDEYRTPVSAIYIAKAVWELVNNNFTGLIHLTGKEKIDRYNFGIRYLQLYPGLNIRCIRKGSLYEAGYPRPADVSMKSIYADKVLKEKSKKITEVLEDIL